MGVRERKREREREKESLPNMRTWWRGRGCKATSGGGIEGVDSGGRATAAEECTRCPCQGHDGVSWVSVQDCNARIFQDLVLQECAAVTVSYYQTFLALLSFYLLLFV